MIEIKCTKQEKENIVRGLIVSDVCCMPKMTCPKDTMCIDCLEQNIRWTIEGESKD